MSSFLKMSRCNRAVLEMKFLNALDTFQNLFQYYLIKHFLNLKNLLDPKAFQKTKDLKVRPVAQPVNRSPVVAQAVVPKRGGGETQIAVPKVGTPEPKGTQPTQVVPVPKSSMQLLSSSSTSGLPVPKSGLAVRTTRFGTVYHTNDHCRFLKSRSTGAARLAHLCSNCRALLDSQGRDLPVLGDVLKMKAFDQTYHVQHGCNESGQRDNFQCCTVCNSRL